MLDSSHGSAYPHKGPDGAPCLSTKVYGQPAYDLRRPARSAATVSDVMSSAADQAARRRSIKRRGTLPADVSCWSSRDAWIAAVRAWVESPDFAAVCASVRVSITSATVVSVAVLWAGYADHSTGRRAAVTRARIAETLGCSIKTVSRVWQVLGVAGFAVEVARGYGSSAGRTGGNRASVWAFVIPCEAG